MKYEPSATPEERSLGILHLVDGYYVSNEGTKAKPNYHVWRPKGTHVVVDSAYADLSLAVARCNFIAKHSTHGLGWEYIPYPQPEPFKI